MNDSDIEIRNFDRQILSMAVTGNFYQEMLISHNGWKNHPKK